MAFIEKELFHDKRRDLISFEKLGINFIGTES
jgi:hypothetical protein